MPKLEAVMPHKIRPSTNWASVSVSARQKKYTATPRFDSSSSGRRPKRSDSAPSSGKANICDSENSIPR
ncbi:hypothetical protein D9M68_945000 [compost metagenome]